MGVRNARVAPLVLSVFLIDFGSDSSLTSCAALQLPPGGEGIEALHRECFRTLEEMRPTATYIHMYISGFQCASTRQLTFCKHFIPERNARAQLKV